TPAVDACPLARARRDQRPCAGDSLCADAGRRVDRDRRRGQRIVGDAKRGGGGQPGVSLGLRIHRGRVRRHDAHAVEVTQRRPARRNSGDIIRAVIRRIALPALMMVVLTAGRAHGQSVARGSALFQLRCADCHGVDAKGVHGPDLTVLFANGATDDRVFQTIRNGVPGTEMPSSTAPDDEIRALVAYLRTFVATPSTAGGGDVAKGERVFSASCSACHRVNGRGGVLGPDLSRVGASRSRELLTREIRDASAAISPGFQPVTIVTNDGQRIRGARKNEDAYSIQIMDMRQRLQGYVKADLREVVSEKASLMPDFKADRLGDGDLNDVLAYLGTLRVDAAATAVASADAPLVTSQDLLDGFKNTSRWTMYSGDYTGRRHSPLTQITPQNVGRLTAQWAFQADTIATGRGFESTPLVIDGVIYLTGANGNAWAID